MSFDRLIRPDLPEAQTPEWQQGLIMGWVPGIITAIEGSGEAEGLGRIKVRCDLISPHSDIPNSWDGYVWVLEDYVNAGIPGGSHRMLQIGSQVALVPMFGNPKQMLMLGAIHSRSDRPSPLFDRTKQVYGTQSPNAVYSMTDDANQEQTEAYPHGVMQQVSRKGDVIAQTRDGARTHLMQDGTTRVENALSSTVLSKEGKITSRSAGDAVVELGEDGIAQVKAEKFDSAMVLNELDSQVTGPMPEIGALMKQASGLLSGNLGGMLGNLGQLQGMLGQIGQIGGVDSFSGLLGQITPMLSQMSSGLPGSIAPGMAALGKLQGFSPEKLGETLLPQVQQVLGSNLHQLVPELDNLIAQQPSLGQINQFLSSKQLKQLSPDLEPVLQGLGHDPKQVQQMVLAGAMPKGYESFSNLAGLGLHDKLGSIQKVAKDLPIQQFAETMPVGPDGLPGVPEVIDPQVYEQAYGKILELLPEDIRGFARQNSKIKELLNAGLAGKSIDVEGMITQVLGSSIQGFAGNAVGSLSRSMPLLEQVPKLAQLGNGLFTQDFSKLGDLGNLASGLGIESFGSPEELLQQGIGSLAGQLAPMLGQGLGDLNKLQSAIPDLIPRAKVFISEITSELQARMGTSRVYADESGVGATSLWGGFGFSAAGSFMNALGPIAMQALGAAKAGLKLDPDAGAMLQGLDTGGEMLSQVRANGNTVQMESGQNAVQVNPQGVFINGLNVADLLTRIAQLESRLAALEGDSASNAN